MEVQVRRGLLGLLLCSVLVAGLSEQVVELEALSDSPEEAVTDREDAIQGPKGALLGTEGRLTVSFYRDQTAPDDSELLELGEGTESPAHFHSKPRRLDGEAMVVKVTGLPASSLPSQVLLETAEDPTDGFSFTNGLYGGRGGAEKWLRCESKCTGSGYGGYGWCYTAGEGKPWGGCMPPGSDPMADTPPTLYHRNRIGTASTPRAHMHCTQKLWVTSNKQQVGQCGQCEHGFFLIPNMHLESKMVGSCFSLAKFQKWSEAISLAKEGTTRPMDCSLFTNGKGMETSYFGGSEDDKWNSDPTHSPYNPRGFVCTSSSDAFEQFVTGDLKKGFREMRVFHATIARFVSCYTAQEDGGPLQCIKQKRIGKCRSYFMRNAAFDSRAAHVVSPETAQNNTAGVDWKNATSAWDKAALEKGQHELEEGEDPQLGLSNCDAAWKERLVAFL